MPSNARPRFFRALAPAAVVAAVVCAPSPAQSQTCAFDPGRFPASPPPASLWNGLEPAYTVLPTSQTGGLSRDSSWDNTNGNWGTQNPFWWSLDIEQGYLYTAFSQGFQVWNIGADATQPPRMVNKSIHALAPVLHTNPHSFEIPRDVDAAPGDHNLVALAGASSMGMLLVNATNKANPVVYYQDHGPSGGDHKDGAEVYVGSIGGRYYGFLAAVDPNTGPNSSNGLWVYDLTRAKELGAASPCVEQLPVVQNCPGVYKARLATKKTNYVHGAADGSSHYVVFAGGDSSHKGFEIWDVSNPSAPVRKLTGLSGDVINGVALWRDASQNKLFLALANRKPTGVGTLARGQFYDVTCLRTSCGSLPSPIYDFPLTGHVTLDTRSTVTFSRTGGETGTPYVYFGRGGKDPNSTALQPEWLLDVTGLSPSNPPDDVTGGDPLNGGAGQPTIQLGGMTLGYFSYYSHCAPDGTNWYASQTGQVAGSYFYRAGYSILDIHELVDVGPEITVTGPPQGYTGQTLTYAAVAANCTATPGAWSWQLGGTGGTIVGSQTGSSINVQWSQTGAKTVTAFNNSGCSGATTVPAAVQILSAQPAIGGVTANPTTAPVCTQITFEATNVTGQPPLTFDWTIEQGGNPVPGEVGSGNPFAWDTEGMSPGTYRGRVDVGGPGGNATSLSPNVTLTALQTLPQSGGFTISNDPPNLGTVQFHSNVAGATEWRWNFGDGTILQTENPAQGVNPVHVYDAVGAYDVTLEVRNCIETNFRTSQVLEVEINEVQTLEILDFRAVCSIAPCIFQTGQPVTFTHNVIGDPTLYEYNWDGAGGFEQSSPTPINTHSYPQAGTFSPVLRVTKGSQTDTFTAPPVVVVSGGPPPTPSISVSGPTSREVGQQGTYTASAVNCSPSASGWTWTTSGGTGSSTSNSITLSWSATGSKTVTARNSACGAAVGTRVVSVTNPGGGGPGNLNAVFSFTPASPEAGQAVSFDGSASTGELIDWVWDFGDGADGSGETASHTYAQPGTYTVELMVAAFGQGCPQGICRDTATRQITVGDGGNTGNCVPDDETLCLLDGRFQVSAHWRRSNGQTGVAHVYESFAGDRTGMFWFFSEDNVELITKSLDATQMPNPAYWFFYGGLSNVEYWIDVVDTVTGAEQEYHNLPGVICGVADTDAFDPVDQPLPSTGGGAATVPRGGQGVFEVSSITGAGASGTCVPSDTRLCLLDGRYAVEVDWINQHNGNAEGVGHAIPGTDRTGYFWFFNQDNVELVTKMLDPGAPFQHVWVFWGALSDVDYTIRVTDTVTQVEREYHNLPGSYCGGADTTAFDAD